MLNFLFVLALLIATVSGSWMNNVELRKLAGEQISAMPQEWTIDFDLPADQRWLEIGAAYKNKSWQIVNYLRENLPKGLLEPLEKVAGELLLFFKDYGEEMKSYADVLGVTQGDIVMVNLVHQMEHLGVTCDNWNNAGPVNPKLCLRDQSADKYSTSLPIWQEGEQEVVQEQDYEHEGPGACTSFVASNDQGQIFHGRNLDWNLEGVLKQFIITVRFTRGGQQLFTGTTMVGFVGLLHAVKPNAWSMDARRKGGSIALNLLESVFRKGARTPEQQARWTFEHATDFDEAVQQLSSSAIVNDAYFIVSGTKYPQGTVLARKRSSLAHKWNMADPIAGQGNFFVGVTNYDQQLPPPPSDSRSGPMTANLNALACTAFDNPQIWTVLKTCYEKPTKLTHTSNSKHLSAFTRRR